MMEYFQVRWLTFPTIVPYLILCYHSCHHVDAYTVYMDKYGHCGSNSDPYFTVNGDTYTVLAQGGEAYKTMVCTITFKTVRDDKLCLKFRNYRMDDCEVELRVYDKNSATGYYEKYYCHTESKNWCSSENYVTLQLRKVSLDAYNYDFEIEVREKGRSDVMDGSLDTFVISIGVIIVIIIGVVGLIAVLAIVIVCCCCKKNRHYGRVYKKAHKKPKKGATECQTSHDVQPTAPPIHQEEMETFTVSEVPGSSSTSQGQAPLPEEQPPAYYPTLPSYNESEKLPIT